MRPSHDYELTPLRAADFFRQILEVRICLIPGSTPTDPLHDPVCSGDEPRPGRSDEHGLPRVGRLVGIKLSHDMLWLWRLGQSVRLLGSLATVPDERVRRRGHRRTRFHDDRCGAALAGISTPSLALAFVFLTQQRSLIVQASLRSSFSRCAHHRASASSLTPSRA